MKKHIKKVKGIIRMKCPKCGEEISPNAKFCKYCGTKAKQALFCENCGAELADDSVFCPECGQKVSSIPEEEGEKREAPAPEVLIFEEAESQEKKPETDEEPTFTRSTLKTEKQSEPTVASVEKETPETKESPVFLTVEKKKSYKGILIACVIGVLCLVILILVLIMVSRHDSGSTDDPKGPKTELETTITDLIPVETLYVLEYRHKGLATVIKKDIDPSGQVDDFDDVLEIYYNAIVQFEIDVSKISGEYDETNNVYTLKVPVPKAKTDNVVVPIEYYYSSHEAMKKYGTSSPVQESNQRRVCSENLNYLVEQNKKLFERAQNNAEIIIKSFLQPILDAKEGSKFIIDWQGDK